MLDSIKNMFFDLYNSFTIISAIDIFITGFIIYLVINWIKDTQAMQVAKGVLVVLLATQLSEMAGFIAINYVLRNVMTVGFIALVVMFQPELRRGLERLGSTKVNRLFRSLIKSTSYSEDINTIKEVISAVESLSSTKTGALIVFERNSRLKDIIDTGVRIDSCVTKQLLLNIFTTGTPLHDGAVIITRSDMRIAAAACLLPLTQNRGFDTEIGTRHRSAIGISENSDSITLIVSEETGVISYAVNGQLSRFIDALSLKGILAHALGIDESKRETADKAEQS